MFKELKILSIQGTNNLISKWADELNSFHMKKHKGPIHIGEKKHSISLAIREMPINTTLEFSLTPVRRAIIKETKQQQMLAKMGVGDALTH